MRPFEFCVLGLSELALFGAQTLRCPLLSYAKLANGYRTAGQLPEARQQLVAGQAIIARLVAQHPDWAEWKKDLAWFDGQIAALQQ